MKFRIAIALVIVAVFGGVAAFLYLTRPTLAPSQDAAERKTDSSLAENKEGEAVLYKVDPTRSSARFEIGEVLNGEPVHVVGVNDQVTGEILLNFKNPSESRIGTFTVNARSFVTDNERRNSAIVRLIFKSEDPANEFITFVPTGFSGLPEVIKPGDVFVFTIAGDLTVSGVTKPATFNAEAELISVNELSGSAETTVLYKDFGLTVPSLPFLADVDENVGLHIDFVANKQ